MLTITKKLYPFVLLLLFCVTYIYKGKTWQVGWHGLGFGTVILGIIGLALLYKLKGVLQKICIQNGIQYSQIFRKYDYYFVFAFFITLFHGSWYGKNNSGTLGKVFDPEWTFHWSDHTWQVPFLVLLFAVILLYKVYVLFNLTLNMKDG